MRRDGSTCWLRILCRQVEIEGDMSDYVPANDDEKDKLAQGYVKYRSKWMSAPAYREELRKEFEASKKRTEEIKAHSDWDHAWTKKTAHFVVKTDTSAELLDYYADLLEAYYALQDDRLGIKTLFCGERPLNFVLLKLQAIIDFRSTSGTTKPKPSKGCSMSPAPAPGRRRHRQWCCGRPGHRRGSRRGSADRSRPR